MRHSDQAKIVLSSSHPREGYKMKNLFLLIPLITACSLLSPKPDPVKVPKPPKELGEYLQGPCDLPNGKHCNSPGICCLSDNACHSVKEKCFKK